MLYAYIEDHFPDNFIVVLMIFWVISLLFDAEFEKQNNTVVDLLFVYYIAIQNSLVCGFICHNANVS